MRTIALQIVGLLSCLMAIAIAPTLSVIRQVHRSVMKADRQPWFRPALAFGILACSIWHPVTVLAMPVVIGALTEGRHTGEFILSEAEGDLSRDTVTVTLTASQTLKAGSVLGKITATGKYVLYDNGASDGTQTAVAILYDNLHDGGSGGDQSAAVINCLAEVRSADLVWKNDADITAGLVDLAALFIKARS